MGGFLGALRGGLAGANEAVGNTQVAAELEAANQRSREKKDAEARAKIAPHGLAIQGLRQKLATLDPVKNAAEYNGVVDEIQNNVHAMREILHPDHKLGAADWLKTHTTDRLHITSHDKRVREEAARRASGVQQDEETAQGIAKGTVPYNQTPEFLAKKEEEEQRIAGQIKVAEARLQAGGWTKSGNPVQVDDGTGTGHKVWAQQFNNKAGEIRMERMPPEYKGPYSQWKKGTMVKSASSPTGFAQLYLDPYDATKVVGWQPITESRYYAGTTTTGTSTDAFGVKTSSTRTTQPMQGGPVDLSGIAMMPAEPEPGQNAGPAAPSSAAPVASPGAGPAAGAPGTAAPMEGPKTKELRQARGAAGNTQSAGKLQLDENGMIPQTAGNPYLVSAANELLQGKSQKDIKVPQKDLMAAVRLAEKFGYLGEGMFTPRERMQVEQAQVLVDKLRDSDDAKAIFDKSGFLKRPLIQELITQKSPTSYRQALGQNLAASTLSQGEADFVEDMRQFIGRVQSLAMLTRGSGRATEAAVNRMIAEIPNLIVARNWKNAEHSLDLIQNEIDIGMGKKKAAAKPAGGPKTEELKKVRSGQTEDQQIIDALNAGKAKGS